MDDYAEQRERLTQFLDLESGWDSYGGAPISPTAIELAHDVLRRAEALGLPVPHCFPGSGGEVSFEGNYRDRAFILECKPDGGVGWLLCPSRDAVTWEEEDAESPETDDAITRVLEWAKAQWVEVSAS